VIYIHHLLLLGQRNPGELHGLGMMGDTEFGGGGGGCSLKTSICNTEKERGG